MMHLLDSIALAPNNRATIRGKFATFCTVSHCRYCAYIDRNRLDYLYKHHNHSRVSTVMIPFSKNLPVLFQCEQIIQISHRCIVVEWTVHLYPTELKPISDTMRSAGNRTDMKEPPPSPQPTQPSFTHQAGCCFVPSSKTHWGHLNYLSIKHLHERVPSIPRKF